MRSGHLLSQLFIAGGTVHDPLGEVGILDVLLVHVSDILGGDLLEDVEQQPVLLFRYQLFLKSHTPQSRHP